MEKFSNCKKSVVEIYVDPTVSASMSPSPYSFDSHFHFSIISFSLSLCFTQSPLCYCNRWVFLFFFYFSLGIWFFVTIWAFCLVFNCVIKVEIFVRFSSSCLIASPILTKIIDFFYKGLKILVNYVWVLCQSKELVANRSHSPGKFWISKGS